MSAHYDDIQYSDIQRNRLSSTVIIKGLSTHVTLLEAKGIEKEEKEEKERKRKKKSGVAAMSAFESKHFFDLRRVFQDAAVMCSERCLYQSAKWYDKS